MCSGRKRKATGFVYLQGSPYCDAEGSSQVRSCLHDAIINSSPRIGGNWLIVILSTVSTYKGERHTHDRVGKMRMCIIFNDHYTYNETWEREMGAMRILLVIDDGVYVCICRVYLYVSKNIHHTCIRQSFFTIVEEWILWCNHW